MCMQSVSEREMEKMLEKEGEFVYYDFETRMNIDADSSKYYTPNCCVLRLATLKENGKHRQITFMGDDCVEKLMDYLLFGKKSLLDEKIPYKFVAQNAGSFDGHILLCGYLKQTWVKPNIIFDGTRINPYTARGD